MPNVTTMPLTPTPYGQGSRTRGSGGMPSAPTMTEDPNDLMKKYRQQRGMGDSPSPYDSGGGGTSAPPMLDMSGGASSYNGGSSAMDAATAAIKAAQPDITRTMTANMNQAANRIGGQGMGAGIPLASAYGQAVKEASDSQTDITDKYLLQAALAGGGGGSSTSTAGYSGAGYYPSYLPNSPEALSRSLESVQLQNALDAARRQPGQDAAASDALANAKTTATTPTSYPGANPPPMSVNDQLQQQLTSEQLQKQITDIAGSGGPPMAWVRNPITGTVEKKPVPGPVGSNGSQSQAGYGNPGSSAGGGNPYGDPSDPYNPSRSLAAQWVQQQMANMSGYGPGNAGNNPYGNPGDPNNPLATLAKQWVQNQTLDLQNQERNLTNTSGQMTYTDPVTGQTMTFDNQQDYNNYLQTHRGDTGAYKQQQADAMAKIGLDKAQIDAQIQLLPEQTKLQAMQLEDQINQILNDRTLSAIEQQAKLAQAKDALFKLLHGPTTWGG